MSLGDLIGEWLIHLLTSLFKYILENSCMPGTRISIVDIKTNRTYFWLWQDFKYIQMFPPYEGGGEYVNK